MEILVYGIVGGMGKFLFLLFAVVALAQRPWPPPGMQCRERAFVMLSPRRADAPSAAVYGEHIAWLTAQMKSGKIILAGPAAGGREVMVFATKDASEVDQVLQNDPLIRQHYMDGGPVIWSACEASK